MSDEKTEQQFALETFLTRLDELPRVIGPRAEPVVAKVKQGILAGLAARDRGDDPAAMASIAAAMEEIARLGETLDETEGMLMQTLATQFVTGMARGDVNRMEEDLSRIQSRAGKPRPRTRE
ncbi:MAG: hypothetical protein ACI8TX_003949 [Hyphomicrobiaceae bacterium]